MGRGVFITGTGTEVGKTVVTAGLLRCLREKGIDAVPMKPIQTGGVPTSSGLQAPDLDFCLETAGLHPSADELCLMAPYIYGPACSPHLAGRMAAHYPDISHITRCAGELLGKHDVLLVEGAGGVMPPLDESTTMADLMVELGFPVLLVSHSGLGTINHTLLSVEALKTRGLDVLGIVFNDVTPQPGESTFIKEDNPATIARFGEVEVLGTLGNLGNLTPESRELWQNFSDSMGKLLALFST
ncbi:dethiobiotin synthase [Candidatus Hydrogenedentota bacterium]